MKEYIYGMSKHFSHKNKKWLGLALLLIGIGILISLLMPPWLLAFIIAVLLIGAGIYLFLKDGRWK
ncbi:MULTISPECIES: hypothetical protein [Caldicellulosiruptor]|uniref:hypothetical protein n=1 Tax=Caldicellulosiruptor TaxID=44000 RepID=UPI0002F1E8BE|nr:MULTISPECIES: hypothetical protein [Caldicellulosiruptor]